MKILVFQLSSTLTLTISVTLTLYGVKNATDLSQIVNFTGCYNLSTSCNQLVNFIKLQQVYKNQACCTCHFQTRYKLSFSDLLKQLAASLWITSLDNKSIANPKRTCRQQAVASHATTSWYRLVVTICCKIDVNDVNRLQLAAISAFLPGINVQYFNIRVTNHNDYRFSSILI